MQVITIEEFAPVVQRLNHLETTVNKLTNILNQYAKQLTLSEFCKATGYTSTHVRRLIHEGQVAYHQRKKHGRITIPVSQLLIHKQI